MSDRSKKLDRRTVLQSIGVGAAATTVGIGTATATGSETGPNWTYEELTGREKWELLSALYETDEFSELYELAIENGNRPTKMNPSARAGRLVTEEVTREIISIELPAEAADEAYLTVGRDNGDGVSVAQLEYNTRTDDGILQEHVAYDATGDSDSSSDQLSVESSESNITKAVINPEDEIRETMNAVEQRMESDRVTTQSVCTECTWAVPLICQNACGAAGGFACGFFGIISGGIGGVGCLTIVNVTCGMASLYGCSGDLADAVCGEVGLC